MGLVSGHAYAVLEILEYQGYKMLLIKNPWGHKRYTGKFSIGDKNWTPQLKQVCHYETLASEDNGIFWVDHESFCKIFGNVYINWNPNLLTYRKNFFDVWKNSEMSNSGFVSVAKNPQY